MIADSGLEEATDVMDDTKAFDAAIDELKVHATAVIRRFAVFCTGMKARSSPFCSARSFCPD